MNLSGLGRLGKVAGIGGISIGAVVLLFNALIGTIPGLPPDQQADVVRLLAVLFFGIGIIGIIAWLASRRAPPPPSIPTTTTTITADHDGMAAGRDNIVGPSTPPQSRRRRN
jgi:hypothetical protein